jgi:hypothetical protein
MFKVLCRAALLSAAHSTKRVAVSATANIIASLGRFSHRCSALSLKGLPQNFPVICLLGHPEVPRVAKCVALGRPGRAQEVPHAGFRIVSKYVDLSVAFLNCI